MDRFRIQNLRCLKDTDYIDLKPLTVLVGKNSSGKSTLLRFFPLMKQTLETRTNEPILWYSPGYVDFGSFDESVNYDSQDNLITFEFESSINREFLEEVLSYIFVNKMRNSSQKENKDEDKINVNIKIAFSKEYINKFELVICDHKIEFCVTDHHNNNDSIINILINGIVIKEIKFISRYIGSYSNILPRIFSIEDEKIISIEKLLKDQLYEKLSKLAYSTVKNHNIDEVMNSIKFGDSNTILKSLKQVKTSMKLEQKLKNLKIDEPDFINIKNNYLCLIINNLIELCNEELESFFSSVKYIAPLRASAERYYRIQGLSLDEIDPQGANIPMLLNNMGANDKKSFNKWTKENFKFEIKTNTKGGHTSLYINYENDFKINLADTGFGYSQVLPIILVLWQVIQKTEKIEKIRKFIKPHHLERDSNFTIVIEQPELHLHPSLQAMLIDTFSKIIIISKEIGISIKIIIETHSETMINRIGHLIAENLFDKDLVNVLIFNKLNSYDSDITSTGYTEEGYLSSWPIGFFSPEEIEC